MMGGLGMMRRRIVVNFGIETVNKNDHFTINHHRLFYYVNNKKNFHNVNKIII